MLFILPRPLLIVTFSVSQHEKISLTLLITIYLLRYYINSQADENKVT